jgi:CBS-domain-containing membrane protein
MRSDSILATLTEDQRAQLYDWTADLGYKLTLEKVALPAPEGFNLQIHRTTLVRFYQREQQRRHEEELLQPDAASRDPVPLALLIDSSKQSLAHHCFSQTQEILDSARRNELSRVLHRLEIAALRREALALEQKRLDLETRKFEFNAAEAAARHATQLQTISDNHQLTDAQKFAQASAVLFGPAATQATPAATFNDSSPARDTIKTHYDTIK